MTRFQSCYKIKFDNNSNGWTQALQYAAYAGYRCPYCRNNLHLITVFREFGCTKCGWYLEFKVDTNTPKFVMLNGKTYRVSDSITNETIDLSQSLNHISREQALQNARKIV